MKLATLIGALLFVSPAMPIGDSEGFSFAAKIISLPLPQPVPLPRPSPLKTTAQQ